MNEFLKKWLIVLLETALRDIKSGNCHPSEEESQVLFDALADIKVNKTQACDFLNISQSQFENEVQLGRIPEGKKLYRGDTHKYWTKRDLIYYIKVWRAKK